MKCGFVILHYLTADDTIKCVESIEKKNKEGCEIVIVDNYSNNGSIEKVEQKIRYKNVHILKNKSNLGFARGNNVGYRYCRETLGLKTIIISNNDIIIKTDNLTERVVYDVKRYNAAIIGPDIESLVDGGHQNPMDAKDLSYEDVKKEINRYRLLYILEKIHLYDFIKNKIKKDGGVEYRNKRGVQDLITDVQLHGAFLIFTEKFTSDNELAFDERTFLYMEEAILREKCKEDSLVMLYDPSIKVLHKEDSSTNALNGSTHSKRLFVFKNMIKSLKALLRYNMGDRRQKT